jgi:hypothetical protein
VIVRKTVKPGSMCSELPSAGLEPTEVRRVQPFRRSSRTSKPVPVAPPPVVLA